MLLAAVSRCLGEDARSPSAARPRRRRIQRCRTRNQSRTPAQEVVAGRTVEPVVSPEAVQVIVTQPAGDVVGTTRSSDDVVVIRSDDGLDVADVVSSVTRYHTSAEGHNTRSPGQTAVGRRLARSPVRSGR